MSMTFPEPNYGPVPTMESGFVPPEDFPFADQSPEDAAEVPESEEVTELSLEERLLFSQLLTVGQRTKTIDVMGHTVVIQSLRVSDELRIGLYCKAHEGSEMKHRAFQLGVCAAGIKTVDGKPLYQAFSMNETDDEVFDKTVAALSAYYPVVLTRIYREIMALDQEFVELATKLGKLSG